MEEILSIFKNDAFSATTLDRVAPNLPYVPQILGLMNVFDDRPIRTRTVELYNDNGSIAMVPTTERGAPDPLFGRNVGTLRTLRTYRISQRDRLQASEIQDLIAMPLGSATQLRGMAQEIAQRGADLRQRNEYTLEAHRLGALQGKILDADGTTVVRDFWAEFGVSQPAEIFFDFTSIANGALIQFITDNIVKPMIRALGNRANPGTTIKAFVGDNFWSKLIAHHDVQQTFALQATGNSLAAALRNNSLAADNIGPGLVGNAPTNRGNAWGTLNFGGVDWINFMGTLNSDITIGAEKAKFFPVGATDVFRTYWSPGERITDVNQLGQTAYLIIQPDVRTNMNEYVDLYFRNYPLFACLFPQALLQARSA
jgi:hypothetical protein